MKMTRKIHVVFVFLVLIMAGVMVRAKTSRAVNALCIPAEFTTMNESVTWEKSITRLSISYDDGVKALSDNMKISFDLYIPADLLSKASTNLTVNPTIGLFDEDWNWDYQIEAKIVDIIVRCSSGGYSATWYDKDAKKEKVIGNAAKCSKTGKYIFLHVSNLPLKEKGVADNGKPRPIKGKKRNLELSINLVANAKQKVTFYLKNTRISNGNKTLYSSSHDKDDVYSYANVNKLKEGLLYVASFNNNKLPKFEKIPDDIRNATAKCFVKISDKKVTENTISKATKEKAKKFAVASYNSLPKWHGTHVNNMYEYGWPDFSKQIPYYTEELIKEIADEGFNFIRVPLDTRIFYSQMMNNGSGMYYKGDGSKVNLNVLENIDDLITWCVKYGIHVCLDVHNTPGGYMIGGDEEASRELLFKNGSKEQKMFYDF